MNSLSWLIYWIGVLDPLSVTLGCVIFFFAAWIFVGSIIRWICYVDSIEFPYFKSFKLPVVCLILAILLQLFTPSRQTALLIAASEIGGRIVTSDQVKSITDPGMALLKQWIKTETMNLKKHEVEKATKGN